MLEGIAAASAAGLTPVKINAVVKRGVNEDSILEMARHFRGTGISCASSSSWMSAIERLADGRGGSAPRSSTDQRGLAAGTGRSDLPGEVAGRYRYLDGQGEIGVIASVTQAFCSTCTRASLSADGKLYTCLFGVRGHDFRQKLRAGAGDEELASFLQRVWRRRTDRYSELRSERTADLPRVEMSYIGG